MPTYEYKCDACGNEFEKFQTMSSEPIKKCPKCGKNKVRRLISAGAGLIFKGSGFYITDYRDKGYSDSAKADAAAGSEKAAESQPSENKAGEAGADSAKPAATESKPAESKTETSSPKESTPTAESKPEPKASKSAKKK